MSFNIEKMHKLPPGDRFFDLNDLWYFFNRWAIRVLYPLPVTANQITFLSLIAGLVASVFFLFEGPESLLWAAGFLYAKVFLDNVDGNLARIRGETSRWGRFFDSFTDFVVTFVVYAAIAFRLVQENGEPLIWAWGFLALLSSYLHCSYYVFYLVNYTSRVGAYKANRVLEDITDQDRQAVADGELSQGSFLLQRVHGWLYGWQDRLIESLDGFSKRLAHVEDNPEDEKRWYLDKRFLTGVSPLCLCTNNMILVVAALFDRLGWGLLTVLVFGNAYLLVLQTWKIRRHRLRKI